MVAVFNLATFGGRITALRVLIFDPENDFLHDPAAI